MEDQDDCVPQDERAIRDRIDDEIVNRELLEHPYAGSRPPARAGSAPPGNFWRLPFLALSNCLRTMQRPSEWLNLYAPQHKSH
jgi:hypothetical protein